MLEDGEAKAFQDFGYSKHSPSTGSTGITQEFY